MEYSDKNEMEVPRVHFKLELLSRSLCITIKLHKMRAHSVNDKIAKKKGR
jgi:hypothetical protein